MLNSTPSTVLILCTITLVLIILLAVSLKEDSCLEKITKSQALPVCLLLGSVVSAFFAILYTILLMVYGLIP